MRRAYDERAWLAWHTAALPHMTTFPTLTDMYWSAKTIEPIEQTVDQQIAAAMAWTAAIQGRA